MLLSHNSGKHEKRFYPPLSDLYIAITTFLTRGMVNDDFSRFCTRRMQHHECTCRYTPQDMSVALLSFMFIRICEGFPETWKYLLESESYFLRSISQTAVRMAFCFHKRIKSKLMQPQMMELHYLSDATWKHSLEMHHTPIPVALDSTTYFRA
mgnify:CR=1 FL=1